MTSTIEEYWRSTLRPDRLAQRRAMARTLHLYALDTALNITMPSPPFMPLDQQQDALDTPTLPANRPTGILS